MSAPKNFSWDTRRGRGRGIAFLRAHLSYAGDDCLLWAMTKDRDGYGLVGFEGGIYKAPTLMCTLAHGERPADHEAAHSCANPTCVNPRHLSWKTRAANQQDRIEHGNSHNGKTRFHKLTVEQVGEILSLKGKLPIVQIAKRFGVSRPTIRDILNGKSWPGGRPQWPGKWGAKLNALK